MTKKEDIQQEMQVMQAVNTEYDEESAKIGKPDDDGLTEEEDGRVENAEETPDEEKPKKRSRSKSGEED